MHLIDAGRKEHKILKRGWIEEAKRGYTDASSLIFEAKSGKRFHVINPKITKGILEQSFASGNWSERVWGNTQKLSQALKEILTVQSVAGQDVNSIILKLKTILGDVADYDARRLIRTDLANIYEQANLQGYKDDGIKHYQYSSVLDLKTSPVCTYLNSKIFEVNKARVGVNYPPMHPHCRSTTVPIVNKNVASDKVEENFDYQKWFVENTPPEKLLEIKKYKNRREDREEFYKIKKVVEKSKRPENIDSFQGFKV